MRRRACLIALLTLLWPAGAFPAPPRVLILHDASGIDHGWIGGLHGRLLANLIGHFQLEARLQPVGDYVAGQMDEHHATFYLGTLFDHTLPESFLEDAVATSRPLCWFKYNLWQWASGHPDRLPDHFGFRFDFMQGEGFNQIQYKGETFAKDPRDPELGRTTVTDTNRSRVAALALDPDTGQGFPYVLQSGRFWYVADSPFSFVTEEDRYLILADLLHDMLEQPHPTSHSAYIRLEDITADYPPDRLLEAFQVLEEEGVPFGVAVIPVLEDPLGVFNEGRPRRLELASRPALIRALQHALRQGGQLLLHGYTHQYRDLPNPLSGLSGDDYEFYRVQTDRDGQVTTFEPLPEDDPAWVRNRLESAVQVMARSGFSSSAWITPHYTASPNAYRIMAERMPRTLQRVLYFDEEGHWASQFFPYPVERDLYGQRVYPENLGHVEGAVESHPGGRRVEDLLRAARRNRVVRDGWASAFFHPFLNLKDLRTLVRGLKELGYEFTSLPGPTGPSICEQSPTLHRLPGSEVTLSVKACGSPPFAYQWFLDGTLLEGATEPSLTLPALDAASTGRYSVTVTNDHGQVSSSPIVVRQLLPPVIQSYRLDEAGFQVRFEAVTGLNYVVEYQDFLGAPSWSATFPVTGQGSLTNLTAPPGGLGRRFFRLRVE